MDAVSLASGIAGLITLALQVSGTIVEYTTAVKDRSKNVKDLQDELTQLASVLSQLRDFLLEEAGRDRDLNEQLVLDRAIMDCKARIERIQAKLMPSQGGRLARTWDKMTWPFKQEDVERLVGSLRRFIHTFEFAVSIRGCSMLSKTSDEVTKNLEETKKISEMSKHIPGLEAASIKTSAQIQDIIELLPSLLQSAESIREISQATKLAEEREYERQKTEILEWLAPESNFRKHSEIQKRRAPLTGQWLLEHPNFEYWLEDEKAPHDLLCIGGPGRGKTVLCSLIVDHLRGKFETEPNVAVAHYYCDFSEHHTQTASHFARCILRQLCRSSKIVPTAVHDFWRDTKNEVLKDLFWFQRLQDVLKRVLATFTQCFVIVDAFDETEPNDQRSGLFDLLELVRASNDNTRIFATTRPQCGIEHNFSDALQIEVSADEKDLRRFIHLKIDEHRYSGKIIDANLRDEIVSQLCSHADGMFLLPALQIKDILNQVTKSAVKRALNTLSSDLKAVFGKTMYRISSLQPEERNLAYSTLMWISHANRPLTVCELQHAIAVRIESDDIDRDDIPEVERILDSCCGLVEHDAESSYIRFVHFSLYEHLRDETHGLFTSTQLILTRACLRYLTYRSLKTLFAKNRNGFVEALKEWPFLEYASTHWGFHAQGVDVDAYKELALQLLENGHNLLLTARVRDLTNPDSRKWSEKMWAWALSGGGGISLAAGFGLTELVRLLSNKLNPVLTARNMYGSTPLHECAMHGFWETAEVLIQKGADLLDYNNGKATPFYLAVSYDQVKTAARLLKNNPAQLEMQCKNGYTALHKACDSGSQIMVKFLLSEGASVAVRDDHGLTPLHLACQRGYISIVELLVLAKAPIAQKSREGLTPLDMSCTGGFQDIVKFLLKQNAPVDMRCRLGWTSLHRAARRGHPELTRMLLRSGAELMAVDYQERTPLVYAIKSGNLLTVQALLEHDQKMVLPQLQHKEKRGSTLKTVAFYTAQFDTYKYLRDLENELIGYDPVSSSSLDPTIPLTQAIERGSLEDVKSILGNQRELLIKPDSSGQTPLHTAFQEKQRDIAEYILDQGVSIDTRGYHQWTPLHIAASLGSLSLVSLALSCDADVNALTETLQTPLHKAASGRCIPVITELLRCGGNPAARNDRGMTAIHICAHLGYIEGVREILKPRWVDKNLVFATDNFRRSPRYWAERGGHLEMAAFLRLVERKAKNKTSRSGSASSSRLSLVSTNDADNNNTLPLSRQTTLVETSRPGTSASSSSFLSPPTKSIGQFYRQQSEGYLDDDWDFDDGGRVSPARTPTMMSRTQSNTPTIEDSSFMQMEQRYKMLELELD